MESYPVIWGVDIGHTSIKAVKLERSGDSVSVLGYSIEPIASGEDVDRDEAVIAALENIAQREDMMTVPVVISLSGRQIFSRTINIPVINKNKASKMVELEARQQIPSDFSEVYWDYHLSPSVDGASYDVALFAARQEIILELIAKCKQANIHLVGISVTSLAVYNFTNYDQEFSPDEYIIVLDVGAENTDLCVYKGDTVWIRNLGVSGNDITRAFMKKFRVSFEEAETLKRQVGESRQAEKIFRVIEGSLGELVSDVKRSLGFYKSQNEDAEFENVVVSGNTFRLPSLSQFMADRLGYAIIELVELERIKVDPMVERGQFLEDLQSLGVAMGLALQGLGTAKADINLLPASLRLQGLLKAKRWAAIAILLLIPVFFLIAYLHEQSQMDENLGMSQDMYETYRTQLKSRQAVQKLMEDFPKVARPVIGYKDYCKHKGAMHYIESSVLQAVIDVRRQVVTGSEDILPQLDERDRKDLPVRPAAAPPEGEDAPTEEGAEDGTVANEDRADPITDQEGADPIMQAAYLKRITVPDQRNKSGVPVFLPFADPRDVTVIVRIPDRIAGPDQNEPGGVPGERRDVLETHIRDLLVERFRSITVSEGIWRNHFPGRPYPEQESERPRLFSDVTNPGRRANDITWYYMDPRKLDPVTGELAPKGERERDYRVPAYDYEFKLTLWQADANGGSR